MSITHRNATEALLLANTMQAWEVKTLPAKADAPSARVGSPSTPLDGKLWLFSGRGGINMEPLEEKGTLWSYDVAQARWGAEKPADSAAPRPSGRSYHCITSDGRSKIYVHSGCPVQGRLSDLWVFDIKDKAWEELPLAPGPARGGASIAFAADKLYRINGFDGKTEQGGSLDVYDVSTASWSSISYRADGVEGPEARSVSTLLPVSVSGKTYLLTMFGERDPSSLGHAGAGKMLSDAWAFDIHGGQWQKVEAAGDAPEGRGWFDADVLEVEGENHVAVVHGGLNEGNERLGDVWKLVFA